jgi:hypothetical protein
MPATYTVAIDYDDDGDFTDMGEDISADVLHLRWRLGMAQPYDSVAAPISAHITVRSPSRAYSPEFTSSDLSPGKPIRIQSDDGVTTRTHFTGFISHVEPLPGTQGERTAVIHARGPEHELSHNKVRLAPQVNVRADQVIQAVLDAVQLRRSKMKGYWVLDVTGHHELGTSTRLAEETIARSLETGKSTFVYAADTWDDGIPADFAIRQMVEAERGRFFVNRSGEAIFYNRHHTLLDASADAAFADSFDGLDYAYGADVVNQVQVTLVLRSIGPDNTVLWSLGAAQAIPPGETLFRHILVRYRDANDLPIGALTVIPPLRGIDYQANTLANGTGADRTSLVDVLLIAADASAATLEIRNRSSQTAYLLAGAQLRGTPLNLGDPITVQQSDEASIAFHGLNILSLDTPALNSLEAADQLARYELARRKDPRGSVRTVRISGQNQLAQVLARTLFDRITIQETQTDHAANYFIVAEAHEVDLGGARHRVAWLLEPAAASAFWVVGTSTLDQTAVLAY